ncbi:hypothetical protein, partial [Desulfovibrio sp. SGI.169]|uniref:hypothetical protein n=1 Tax=Desulfovibrio sp. SGI.169 TaxID=3420561 RepID=UPI003CFF9A33
SLYPEAITENDAYEINTFCSNNRLKLLQEEQSFLNKKIKDAEKLENKVKELFKDELSRQSRPIKRKYKMIYRIIVFLLLLLSCLLTYILFIIANLIPEPFSNISNGVIANLVYLVVSSCFFLKIIPPKIKKFIRKKYALDYIRLKRNCSHKFFNT